ncbi:apolipoprotein N-acyltransferase [bacterium]|nr:apolipoprotein N-acyltransferase [bacterium]
MKTLKLVGLSILGGLLMGISWPATGSFAPVFFIALLPLLYIEYTISQNKEKYSSWHLFFIIYLGFLTFNTYTTFWIWHASEFGMIMAVVLNSLFMSTLFLWFHNIKKKLGSFRGYFSLVTLWLGFEWLHYNWEMSHPWSTFGNTFADHPKLIQWYEYTGVLGGSLWILVSNIVIFEVLKNIFILEKNFKSQLKSISFITIWIVAPILFSVNTYYSYTEKENPIEVVLIQPNIDPFKDKFGGMTEAEQVDRIISLAEQKVTKNTKYIIAPETALPRGCEEDLLEHNFGIQRIRQLTSKYPKSNFIVGANTYINYNANDFPDEKPTSTARHSRNGDGWYDYFNTALMVNQENDIQIYHKSKPVLGVERMPFASILNLIGDFAIDLGGTTGSIGLQDSATNFIDNNQQVAPIICYESIYGEYFSEFVLGGAQACFIITNDGWWRDTPGYKQHLAYGQLRAIESRRSIARSANTGISCFINQRGDISLPTEWWVPDVIKANINLNNHITFYSKHGDIIGRVSAFLAIMMLLWNIVISIKRK